MATISGLLRKVPGEQEGSIQSGIIVESFSLESGYDDCRLPSAELTNTRWQLSALGVTRSWTRPRSKRPI